MTADANPSITCHGPTRGQALTSGALKRAAAVLLTAGLWMSAAPAVAAPGDPDTTFNGSGYFRQSFGGSIEVGEALAVQSDGKIVLVNNTAELTSYAVRLTSTGALDVTFNFGGFKYLGGPEFNVTSVAVQSDGKIVYAGFTSGGQPLDFMVGRLTASGAVDSSFGVLGKVVTPISTVSSNGQPDDRAHGVAIQSDGKIVVVGATAMPNQSGTYNDVAVVRYNSNGTLDTSFSGIGISRVHIGGDGNSRSSEGRDVAIQADGKIVVAATANNGSNEDFAVVRLNTNGTLDTSFNGTGIQTTDIATCSGQLGKCQPDDVVRGVAMQADGKIVLAGWADNSIVDGSSPNNNTKDTNFALVRYNSNGSLDTGFGSGGKVVTRVSNAIPIPGTNTGPQDRAHDLAIQSDGKIVVVGESRSGGDGLYDFALVRYASNGTLDTGFGLGGKVTPKSLFGDSKARAVAIQSDGKILITGESVVETVVARYEGTSVAPPSSGNPRDFNADGKSDILWQNTSTGERYVWYMSGANLQSDAFLASIPAAWQIGGSADFDADGKSDILWRNTNTGDVYVWYMNGAQLKSDAYVGNVPAPWQISGTGDYDADGKPDILWTNASSGDRYVWYMNGRNVKGSAYLTTIATVWQIAGTGSDFDADGKHDILWRNTNTGDVYVWYMNGAQLKSDAYVGNVPANWQIDGTGDYDADGKPDILWTNASSGDRYVWYMNGRNVKGNAFIGNVPSVWNIVAR